MRAAFSFAGKLAASVVLFEVVYFTWFVVAGFISYLGTSPDYFSGSYLTN